MPSGPGRVSADASNSSGQSGHQRGAARDVEGGCEGALPSSLWLCLVMKTHTYSIVCTLVCCAEALLALKARRVMQAVAFCVWVLCQGPPKHSWALQSNLSRSANESCPLPGWGGRRETVNGLFLFFPCLPSLCIRLITIPRFLH